MSPAPDKPIKTNLSLDDALRRAMQVPAPSHTAAAPKKTKKPARKK